MLTEGNLKHMLAVGNLMAKYWDIFGHDKDGGGLGADALFMLGYLHDIGCYKDIEEPDKAGAEIIMHTFPWALNPGHLSEDDFIEPEYDTNHHMWFGKQVPDSMPKSKCEIYKGSMIAHCIRWHKTSPDVYMAFFNVTEDEIPSALCLLWWADMCVGDRDDKTVVRSNTDDSHYKGQCRRARWPSCSSSGYRRQIRDKVSRVFPRSWYSGLAPDIGPRP